MGNETVQLSGEGLNQGGRGGDTCGGLGVGGSAEVVSMDVSTGSVGPPGGSLPFQLTCHGPQTGHLNSLCLSCLVWKMGITKIEKSE